MNSKKTCALLLTAIMVILILTATQVSAKNEEMCYWEQVSGEGFGNLANAYVWSYLNHLYAGGYGEDNDQWGIGDMAIVKPTVANSNIRISKKVSTLCCNPGNVLKYTISYNNTGDVNLTGVVLNDTIPDDTTYAGNLTTDPGTSCNYSLSNRTIICEHIGTLYRGEDGNVTFEVRINASVAYRTIIENCVAVTFDQGPSATSCARAIVTRPVVPLLVNKTVCDPETHEWVDKLNVSASNVSTLKFRCEVHNNETSDLTNTLVWDFLPKSLKYANNAIVHYPFPFDWSGAPDYVKIHREPHVVNLTIKDQPIGTLLIYYFPLLKLKPSENIIIEYNVTVGEESGLVVGYKGINIQFAGGYYETGEWGFGCDYVIITESVWECDIPVPVGTIIENYVAETSDRPHQMNHALAR